MCRITSFHNPPNEPKTILIVPKNKFCLSIKVIMITLCIWGYLCDSFIELNQSFIAQKTINLLQHPEPTVQIQYQRIWKAAVLQNALWVPIW